MDATTQQLLDNIVWHSLTGPHSAHASGGAEARRYAPGFSPIIGFADPERANFAALRPHCEPGEHFYCDGWAGAVPAGWRLDAETTMFKMVWDRGAPHIDANPAAPPAIRLGAEHRDRVLELVALTHPGPFGPRTIELGEYVGCFDGERLVAMAGERMQAGPLREISGVCTHPDFQGRGLARGLLLELVRRQLQRGQLPFLHVLRANEGAHRLYRQLGFSDYREVVARVVSPL